MGILLQTWYRLSVPMLEPEETARGIEANLGLETAWIVSDCRQIGTSEQWLGVVESPATRQPVEISRLDRVALPKEDFWTP